MRPQSLNGSLEYCCGRAGPISSKQVGVAKLVHTCPATLSCWPCKTLITQEWCPARKFARLSALVSKWGMMLLQVSLVINYDLPNSRELYIHRIGRSGRYGRKGVAINFVRSDDVRILRDIEQFYSTQIDEMVSPTGLHITVSTFTTVSIAVHRLYWRVMLPAIPRKL